ncbi:MAG: hypothetical protein ACRCR9_06700 [Chitinophagaceae bacterium]
MNQDNLARVFSDIQKETNTLSPEQVDLYLSILEKMNILIFRENNNLQAICIFQRVNNS